MSHVQGKSPPVHVKEPYGILDMVTCRLLPCNPEEYIPAEGIRQYTEIFLSISFHTGTIKFDHYATGCKFGILKNKFKEKIFRLCFLLNEERPKHLSSLGIDTEEERLFHCRTFWEKRDLQIITVCLMSTILGTVVFKM